MDIRVKVMGGLIFLGCLILLSTASQLEAKVIDTVVLTVTEEAGLNRENEIVKVPLKEIGVSEESNSVIIQDNEGKEILSQINDLSVVDRGKVLGFMVPRIGANQAVQYKASFSTDVQKKSDEFEVNETRAGSEEEVLGIGIQNPEYGYGLGSNPRYTILNISLIGEETALFSHVNAILCNLRGVPGYNNIGDMGIKEFEGKPVQYKVEDFRVLSHGPLSVVTYTRHRNGIEDSGEIQMSKIYEFFAVIPGRVDCLQKVTTTRDFPSPINDIVFTWIQSIAHGDTLFLGDEVYEDMGTRAKVAAKIENRRPKGFLFPNYYGWYDPVTDYSMGYIVSSVITPSMGMSIRPPVFEIGMYFTDEPRPIEEGHEVDFEEIVVRFKGKPEVVGNYYERIMSPLKVEAQRKQF